MAKAIQHIISGETVSNETLKHFFSGKMNTLEEARIDRLLKNDELYKEAYSSLTHAEFCECILVNEKISHRISAAFPSPKNFTYYYLAAAGTILLVAAIWLINSQNEHGNTSSSTAPGQAVSDPDPGKKGSTADIYTPLEENEQGSNPGDIKEEDVSPFNLDKYGPYVPVKELAKENEDKTPQENTGLTFIPENKQPEEKKTDDSRGFVKEDNAMITLKVASAIIAIKTSKEDYNSHSASGSRSVNDPRIGADVNSKTKNTSYDLEDMPYYSGGDQNLQAYLQGRFSNRFMMLRKNALKEVVLSFDLTSKGKIENAEVLGNNVPEQIEQEMIRILTEAPGWTAGKKTGKKYAMKYMIPVVFYW